MTRWIVVAALSVGFASLLPGQISEKKHILFLGANQFYAHDSFSHGMYTLAKIGEESGLFDVRFRTDTELIIRSR